MIDRLKITHLYTIPTVMKFLMKAGDEHVKKYSLSTLKVLALGNPLESPVWLGVSMPGFFAHVPTKYSTFYTLRSTVAATMQWPSVHVKNFWFKIISFLQCIARVLSRILSFGGKLYKMLSGWVWRHAL